MAVDAEVICVEQYDKANEGKRRDVKSSAEHGNDAVIWETLITEKYG